MKVELNHNLFEVINACALSIEQRCKSDNIEVTTHCNLCPLVGACLEVLTGDDSENK